MVCLHKSIPQKLFAHVASVMPILFYAEVLRVCFGSGLFVAEIRKGGGAAAQAMILFLLVTIICIVPCLIFLRINPKEMIIEKDNEYVKLTTYYGQKIIVKISKVRIIYAYGALSNPADWFWLVFFSRYGIALIGRQQYTNSDELISKITQSK
jgi:hypothetical protein